MRALTGSLAAGALALALVCAPAAAAPSVERGVVWNTSHHLAADIYRPQTTGLHPGILLIHGGGWAAGSRDELDWFGRNLAAAGFVAISIDYRLVQRPSVGPHEQWADVQAALGAMLSNAAALAIDPLRIGVLGGSAGGHLAAMLATETQTPLRAAAILWGPTDLTVPAAQLSQEGAATLRSYAQSATKAFAATEFSPVARVSPTACAAWLLVHGERDELVPVAQSRAMRARLAGAGLQVEYLELPGQAHSPQSAEAQTAAGLAIVAFFKTRLAQRD